MEKRPEKSTGAELVVGERRKGEKRQKRKEREREEWKAK